MTTAKWIIAIIATAITSSYATSHFNQCNRANLSATSNIRSLSNITDTNNIATEQDKEFISTEKKYFRNDRNCEIQLGDAAISGADTNASNGNQLLPTIEDMQFAYEKKQTEIAAFREFTERTGDTAVSVISSNYNSEPIDPEWARPKEDELLALLNSNETLRNTTPLELSCKSQNCRLILSTLDGNQGDSLYSAFKTEALQGSDDNNRQLIFYFSNPDSDEIHIYLSKSTFNSLLDGKNE